MESEVSPEDQSHKFWLWFDVFPQLFLTAIFASATIVVDGIGQGWAPYYVGVVVAGATAVTTFVALFLFAMLKGPRTRRATDRREWAIKSAGEAWQAARHGD
jgi:hypothetical protein